MRLPIAAAGCVVFISFANTVSADEIQPLPEPVGTIESYETSETYEVIGTTPSIGCGVAGAGCIACGDAGCSICDGGSVCGGGCNACGPPACGVCGTAQCWDCSHEEGIDIDSLTVEAQSRALYEASKARIVVICPEATGVTLMNQKMSTPGEKRSFTVDVNDRDRVYKYEVKVDVVRGGKKYFKKYKMDDLRAGMILTVAVDAPPYEEGTPVTLAVEVTADAPGGKPPEDTQEEVGYKQDKLAPAVANENVLNFQVIR
jgi:hypothetical protein